MLRRILDTRKLAPCLRRLSHRWRFTPNLSVKVIVFGIGFFLRFSDSLPLNRVGDRRLRVSVASSVDDVRRLVGRSACLMWRTQTSWSCRQWLGIIANFWIMSGLFGSHMWHCTWRYIRRPPDTICAVDECLRSAVTNSELNEEIDDLPWECREEGGSGGSWYVGSNDDRAPNDLVGLRVVS